MIRLRSFCRFFHRTLNVNTEAMGKKGSFFYAVRKGHHPGVYGTWEECQSQVDKFRGAQFKKFASEEQAWSYVRNDAAVPTTSSTEGTKTGQLVGISAGTKRPIEEDQDDEKCKKRAKLTDDTSESKVNAEEFSYMGDAVVVYTDGCCYCNGRIGARAGIGVYWGPNHPLNVAERLPGHQTNQRAELLAAYRALQQAKERNIKKLVLYTDSKFTINGVTSWVKKWKTNGWMLRSGGQVLHKTEFENLDQLNQELEVVWMHIPGHAGYQGNEEADRLSREGAKMPKC